MTEETKRLCLGVADALQTISESLGTASKFGHEEMQCNDLRELQIAEELFLLRVAARQINDTAAKIKELTK